MAQDKPRLDREKTRLVAECLDEAKAAVDGLCLHSRWTRCWNYYYGEQDPRGPRLTGGIKVVERAETRYIVSNRLAATIGDIAPLITDGNPTLYVRPLTASDEDRRYCELRSDTLRAFWHRQAVNISVIRAVKDGLVTGTGFLYATYDPKLKDISVRPLAPWNIYPDPRAVDVESCEYLLRRIRASEKQLIDYYGADPEDLATHAKPKPVEGQEEQPQPAGIQRPPSKRDDIYEVWECWLEGGNMCVTTVGDLVLRERVYAARDWPGIPLVRFPDDDVGQFWGLSTAERLLDAQDEWNRRRTQIALGASEAAYPDMLIPREAYIEGAQLASLRPRQIEYSGDHPPSRLGTGTLNPALMQSLNVLAQEFQETSKARPVTYGKGPFGIGTGVALRILMESASAPYRYKGYFLEAALRRLGYILMALIERVYQAPRDFLVPRPGGAWERMTFQSQWTGEDIIPYEITVEPDSALPVNRAQRADMARLLATTIMEDRMPAIDREALLEATDTDGRLAILKRFEARRQQMGAAPTAGLPPLGEAAPGGLGEAGMLAAPSQELAPPEAEETEGGME